MALSAFDDKTRQPQPAELEAKLGRASVHWHSLIAHTAAEYPPLEETWQFSGAKWGWSLRLKHKKRAVLYMTPCKGHFLAGFALGERAVEAARDSALPAAILRVIDEARKYAEGRAVRLEIRNKRDLQAAQKVAAIKMAN